MKRPTLGPPILILILCSLLSGCFEEPVRERIHIHINGPESFGLTVVQEVSSPDVARGNQAVESRMEEARDALEGGWDRWSRILDSHPPVAEKTSLLWTNRNLRQSVHTAVFISPLDLSGLLAQADLGLDLHFQRGEGWATFDPQGGSQITSRQYKQMHRQIQEWIETVSVYLSAAVETYHHLELNPSEKTAVFSHLFDSPDLDSFPLTAATEDLVLSLKSAMAEVAEQALEISKGNGWSLNELSHLAFDGFPPRLTVSVSGEVIAVEGFEDIGGIWQRPSVDLWTALRALEGQWIHPVLVTAIISPGNLDDQPDPDPRQFASASISAGQPPTPSEINAALMAELEATPTLSLRWRQRSPDTENEWDPLPQIVLDITENAAMTAISLHP